MLSPGPEIIHKGNTRYTNFVGLLFTMATVLLTIYTLNDDCDNFVHYKNPKVVFSERYKNGNNFTVSKNSLKFFIQIQNLDIDKNSMNLLDYSKINQIFEKYGGFLSALILEISKDGFKINNFNISSIFNESIGQNSSLNNSLSNGKRVLEEKGEEDISISSVSGISNLYINNSNTDESSILNNFTLKKKRNNIDILSVYFKECDKSFFEDYNDHIEYGQPKLSSDELENIKKTSFCLPDGISTFLKTTEKSAISLTILIKTLFVKLLQSQGYPNLFATLNYQQLIVNTNPENYKEFYRKVWKYKNFYLDTEFTETQYVKLLPTDIYRDRKIFVVPEFDKVPTINTIENFEQWFKIPKSGTENDITLSLIIQMDTYQRGIDITYTSLDNILNSYGGTSAVFFFLSELLVRYLIRPFFSVSVINEVFQFHENDMTQNEIIDFKTNLKKMFNNLDNDDNDSNNHPIKIGTLEI